VSGKATAYCSTCRTARNSCWLTTRSCAANAVVVPVNPMNLNQRLRHYVSDTGASTIFAPQDLYAQVEPLLGQGLRHVVVATYSDYLKRPTDLRVPEFVTAPAPRDRRRRRGGMGRGAGASSASRGRSRSTGRPVRHAVHVRHNRQSERLHAYAPQRDVQCGLQHAVVRFAPGRRWRCGACRHQYDGERAMQRSHDCAVRLTSY